MGDSRSTTSTNAVMSLFNRHLQKRSEKSLREVPVLAELFDKRPLPGKSGTTMFVPRHIARNAIRALTEGTPIVTCATSAHYYSGTVVGYGDARAYSDFLVMVHEIPTMISDDIDFMSRDAGLKIDDLCRTAISARAYSAETGGHNTFISPDGTTASGSVKSTTSLKQNALFETNTSLHSDNAPLYADGLYHGVFHPRQTYDLFISTSAGSQLTKLAADSAKHTSFLENTEFGAKKLERATIGVLGNIRVIENTNAPKTVNGGTAAAGISASNSGYVAYVMGPGAAAAVDLSTARLKTYMKALGSAGTTDPIDQEMTAGVKFYFVAIGMDVRNRMRSIPSGKTL